MEAVILAAGESSRFQPLSDNRHKCLTELFGKTVVEHTVEKLRENGVESITVVQGPEKEIEEELGETGGIGFVVQEEPLGMGNALEQVRGEVEDDFIVLNPYRSDISRLMEEISGLETDYAVVGEETDRYGKYGIIDFGDGYAREVVEKPGEDEAPSDWRVVGFYRLHTDFFSYLDRVEDAEYSFEDALSLVMEEEDVPVVQKEQGSASLKYPWDVFDVVEELFGERERHVSDDAEIADSAVLTGKVIVEKGAEIMENAVVKGPAYIGENSTIGDNAVVRELSLLERNVTVGVGSEVKNTVMQPGSSFHSGYIGDSVVGRDSSFGAGTVVANRLFRKNGGRPEIEVSLPAKGVSRGTGRTSVGVFTGEKVQVGVNSSIMPGVLLGSGSKVLPGSVVEENLGPDEVNNR